MSIEISEGELVALSRDGLQRQASAARFKGTDLIPRRPGCNCLSSVKNCRKVIEFKNNHARCCLDEIKMVAPRL